MLIILYHLLKHVPHKINDVCLCVSIALGISVVDHDPGVKV